MQKLKFKLDKRILGHQYLRTIHVVNIPARKVHATLTMFYNSQGYHVYFCSDTQEFTISDNSYNAVCKQFDKIINLQEFINNNDYFVYDHNLIDGVRAL